MEPGEEVLVLLPTSSNKLLAQWQGPYCVVCKVGKVSYEIDMPNKRKRRKVFHVNMLKNGTHQRLHACFWIVEEEISEPDEEESISIWKGECGVDPIVNPQLTEQQKGQILELLTVFEADTDGRLGRTSACQYHIHTKDGPLVRQQPYCLPNVYKEAVEKEKELMLKQGIIEPASSEWVSPIVIIKKKDDTICLCVNYQRLNAMTQVDAYLMPRIDDILGQARYITTFDLAKGYWQIPVAEDRPKTPFITPRGLYQFKMMPFGLCGAPGTFQRMMDQVIKGCTSFPVPTWMISLSSVQHGKTT